MSPRDAVLVLTERPLALYASACVRALLGLVALATLVVEHDRRHELFGPDGYYPRDLVRDEIEQRGGFNLHLLHDGALFFDVLYHLGLLVALCVVLGVGGRLVLLLHWVLLWSLLQSNPMLMDGGDNVMLIVLPFLCLTSSFRHLSLTRWASAREPARLGWPAVLAHNTGVLAVATQICIVYLISGTYKLQGPSWMDGTALYYVFSVPEFAWPVVTDRLLGSDVTLVLGAYAATALLVFFTPLVLNRACRPWVVAAMVCFHLSIGLLMGLTSFALAMIACDLIFVDAEVRAARRAVGRAWAAVADRVRRHLVRVHPARTAVRPADVPPAAAGAPVHRVRS